ncbi:MAG: hypothetical protein KDB23_27375 [Planctomycetales bacterium]|nr:hypothetical protein [Planctomycetales bacterium]
MSTDTTTEQATVVRLLVSVPPAELAAVLSKLIGFSVTPLADGQPGENEPEPPAEAAEDVELDDTDAEEESTESLASRLQAYERRIIEAALRRNAYHRKDTADELGVSRVTLYNRMKAFGMPCDWR